MYWACRSSPPCATPMPWSTSTVRPRREASRRRWPPWCDPRSSPCIWPSSRATFRFHDLEGSDEFAVGAVKVKVRPVPHIGRTLGFRLEADGQVLAYLSDHQAPLDLRTVEPDVLELCDGADLLLHDAQYTEQEFARIPDWGHSTATYAVRVARESGVKRLMPVPPRPGPHRRGDRPDARRGPPPGRFVADAGGRRGRRGHDRGPGPDTDRGLRRRLVQGRHEPVHQRRDHRLGAGGGRAGGLHLPELRLALHRPALRGRGSRPAPPPAGPGSPGPGRSA